MSDTPITDKHEEGGEVPARIARELERENAELRERIESIRTNAMAHGCAETQLEIILRLADEALA